MKINLPELTEKVDALSQSINRLSCDDYNSLSMVSKIRQAIRRETAKTDIAAFIKNEYDYQLHSHFSEEENLLFATLPHADDLRILAQRQHDQLRYIAWICSNDVEIPDTLPEDFANLLEEHIRFEERTLFPYIHRIMKLKNVKPKRVAPSSSIAYRIL